MKLFSLLLMGTVLASCKDSSDKKEASTTSVPESSEVTKLSVGQSVARLSIQIESLAGSSVETVETTAPLFSIGDDRYIVMLVPIQALLKKAPESGFAYLPVAKSVSLVITPGGSGQAITIDKIDVDKTGNISQGVRAFAVGTWLRDSKSDKPLAKLIRTKFAQKFVTQLELKYSLRDDLPARGIQLRNKLTSFMLVALPKSLNSSLASLEVPQILTADRRGTSEELAAAIDDGAVLQLIKNTGSGATTAVDVNPLNGSVKEVKTPFFKLTEGSEIIQSQLWEIAGSGICEPESVGSGVFYRDQKGTVSFVGYAVKSTSIANKYFGEQDCSLIDSDDTATIIVSPAAKHIEALRKLL